MTGPADMTEDLFRGFETVTVAGAGADIFLRYAGNGPPLVLLHGYPQTHVHWHCLAPRLAETYSVFCLDLRGYGASSIPSDDAGDPAHPHIAFAKRSMAADVIAVMRHFGHETFSVAGHDRGGRVAYRLALDYPEHVDRLLAFDIIPTIDVWEDMRWATSISAYHWPFLAQPAPMPETLILSNPEFYCDWTLASWTAQGSIDAFDPAALSVYRAQMADSARVHAMCEDYRAGATSDRLFDQADRDAGRRITVPTLALYSATYLVARAIKTPPEIWSGWAERVTGVDVDSGHFLAEENPGACLDAVAAFFKNA
ncbi:MAG: alpha/beta hydrolase [Pseudomonadota bacterium]